MARHLLEKLRKIHRHRRFQPRQCDRIRCQQCRVLEHPQFGGCQALQSRLQEGTDQRLGVLAELPGHAVIATGHCHGLKDAFPLEPGQVIAVGNIEMLPQVDGHHFQGQGVAAEVADDLQRAVYSSSPAIALCRFSSSRASVSGSDPSARQSTAAALSRSSSSRVVTSACTLSSFGKNRAQVPRRQQLSLIDVIQDQE